MLKTFAKFIFLQSRIRFKLLKDLLHNFVLFCYLNKINKNNVLTLIYTFFSRNYFYNIMLVYKIIKLIGVHLLF